MRAGQAIRCRRAWSPPKSTPLRFCFEKKTRMRVSTLYPNPNRNRESKPNEDACKRGIILSKSIIIGIGTNEAAAHNLTAGSKPWKPASILHSRSKQASTQAAVGSRKQQARQQRQLTNSELSQAHEHQQERNHRKNESAQASQPDSSFRLPP